MITLTRVKIEDNTKAVKKAASTSVITNLRHAAGSIRKDAIASIKIAVGASKPGTPPHSHRGLAKRKKAGKGRRVNRNALLKRSIAYEVNSTMTSAVIGPIASDIGDIGWLHEFGGSFKGGDYPERPYMEPALRRVQPRFADSFKGSIGQ